MSSLTPFHLVDDEDTETRRLIRIWLAHVSQQWDRVIALLLHPPLHEKYIIRAIVLLKEHREEIRPEQYGKNIFVSRFSFQNVKIISEAPSFHNC